ncbi:MAG: FAD-binding oxidoreductase, partial [bacterium]|nr:FAD-binding oxidoreductase [bacterium]
GITGLISAYMLLKEGKTVSIFEKKAEFGLGATKYTTAFITQALDTDYSDLISIHGESKARKIARSHAEAIHLIETIVVAEHIECEFMRCSNFIYANNPKEAKRIHEESVVLKKLGFDVEFNTQGHHLGFENNGYMEMRNQAKFNITLFIKGLSATLCRKNARIFLDEEVIDIQLGDVISQVKTTKREIESRWVIIATYEPFNKPLGLYFKKAFYTSYVFDVKIPKGKIREGIYEDTQDPYYYFRIDPLDETHDTLVIGGEDHRTDLHISKEKSFSALESYLKKLVPSLPFRIESKWSGPILEPVDGLPFIGPHHSHNLLYAMAFSGNGMTYSAISALIFADIISGRKNEWLEIYSARRIPTFKALAIKGKDYAKEMIFGALENTIKQRKKKKK